MYKKIKLLSFVLLFLTFSETNANDGAIRSLEELYKLGKEIKGTFPELLKLRGNHLIYGFHGYNSVEGGIGFGSRNILKPHKYTNYSITGLLGYRNDKYFGGLDAGYKKAGMFGLYALHMTYYNDFEKSQSLMLRPELGLTFFGLVDFTYGINFPVIENQLLYPQHLFSVRITRQRIKHNAKKHIVKINNAIKQFAE